MFNAVNFHGYQTSKKGNRSKIELLEKLNSQRGLSKRRKNILGGNFNFVEEDSEDDSGRKERPIKKSFVKISSDYKLFVRRCIKIKVLSRKY